MSENSLPESQSSETPSEEKKPVESPSTESVSADPVTSGAEEVAKEIPAEDSKSVEVASEESQASTDETPKPKREFKPAINPDMAKAKPSIAGGAAEVATEVSQDEKKEEKPVSAPSATAAPASKEVVEIPDNDDLDSTMEAEIAAALSSGEKNIDSPPESEAGVVAGAAAVAGGLSVPNEEELQPGDRVKGTVESVHGENIVLHLGYRMSGLLVSKNLDEKKIPKVGDQLELIVDRVDEEEGVIILNHPTASKKVEGNWDAIIEGQVVDCLVTKTNKGGLDVTVSGLRAFLPASQVGLGFTEDMETFVGQKLKVKVIDVKPAKKNLVVSRKAIELEERAELAEVAWEKLIVGQECTGTVKTIKDYGAFVDIGGIDGLLHVAEMSWQRIKNPSEILSQGQQVQVKIKSLDKEKKKISLSMKELATDPWQHVETKFAKGSNVSGSVCRLTDFGAFVTLDEGVDGLIHISEVDHKRINKVAEVLKVGEEVEVQVLEVNKNKRRISLSLKALKEDPAKAEAEAAAIENEKQIKKLRERQTEPLKGGIVENSKGGGLFGNPNDFK